MSHEIQGVHEILIGPVGQFQSVTKGVQIVKRGPWTCRRERMLPVLEYCQKWCQKCDFFTNFQILF